MWFKYLKILLNKCRFLSLNSSGGLRTFVSSSNSNGSTCLSIMKRTNAITGLSPFSLIGVVAFVCLSLTMQAQGGWELYYGGSAEDYGEAVVQTRDHGFLIAGYSESFGDDNDLDVYLIRTDVDGEVVWMKVVDEGWVEHAFDLVAAPDGGYIVVGDIAATPGQSPDMYMLKVDDRGNVLWSRQFGGAGADQAFAVTQTPDGGYLLAGRSNSFGSGQDDIYLVKTDAEGNFEWDQVYGGDDDEVANDVVMHNGGYAIAGVRYEPGNPSPDAWVLLLDAEGALINDYVIGTPAEREEALGLAPTADGGLIITGLWGNNSDAFLLKTDADGNEEWMETYGAGLAEVGRAVRQLDDGGYVVAGTGEVNAFDADIYLFRTDADGQLLWDKYIGRNTHWDEGADLTLTADGGVAIAGVNSLAAVFINDVSLVKADLQGRVKTNYFVGQVFFDKNQDCTLDSGEPGLNGWILKAIGSDGSVYASSDADGRYAMRLDMGQYDLVLVPKNAYWSACIDTFHNVQVTEAYDTLTFDFPVHEAVSCPAMQVDVSAGAAVVCASNTWVVSYCNEGPVDADNVRVDVVLGRGLTFESASIAPALVQDSLVRFELGPVASGDCGRFTLDAFMDCDAMVGQVAEVRAHIVPDSICLPANPAWSGASIRVTGRCDADSVRFTIENAGAGNPVQPLKYIVIEDVILRNQETHQTASGQAMTVSLPRNGATWRLVAEQAPHHPGRSYPTVAVEGCVAAGTPFTTGVVTQFPEDENDLFEAIDVQESVSAVTDAPLLRGYPKGYGDSMYVTSTTQIDYLVRFENTSEDTVTRVVIRDTLSPWLLPETVEKGASSHPYELQVYDRGIVKIVIEDVILASSSSGSGTSGGFVQFRISQKPDNAPGTHIYNRAVAYVGYDAPAPTEQTLHIVEGTTLTDFLVVTGVFGPTLPDVEVRVWPNPFADAFVLEVAGAEETALQWQLSDVTGRPLRSGRFEQGHARITGLHLPKGIYILTIRSNESIVYTAKVVAQ